MPWLQPIGSSTIPLSFNSGSNNTELETPRPTPQKCLKVVAQGSKNWITSRSDRSLWKDEADSNFSTCCSTSDSLVERKQCHISSNSTPKKHIIDGDGEGPETKTQQQPQRRKDGPLTGLFGVDRLWQVEESSYFCGSYEVLMGCGCEWRRKNMGFWS